MRARGREGDARLYTNECNVYDQQCARGQLPWQVDGVNMHSPNARTQQLGACIRSYTAVRVRRVASFRREFTKQPGQDVYLTPQILAPKSRPSYVAPVGVITVFGVSAHSARSH